MTGVLVRFQLMGLILYVYLHACVSTFGVVGGVFMQDCGRIAATYSSRTRY